MISTRNQERTTLLVEAMRQVVNVMAVVLILIVKNKNIMQINMSNNLPKKKVKIKRN